MNAASQLEILGVPQDNAATGSHLLRNPMAPGLAAWLLLCVAHVISGGNAGTSKALFAVGVWFGALFYVFRHVRIPLPWVAPRDIKLISLLALWVLLLEMIYFGGLPLFGTVRYYEFGFPFLHHIVFALWVVPLLAPRRNALYLCLVLVAGAAIFNRQIMLLALAGFLLRKGLRHIGVPLGVGAAVVALGSLRNRVYGIEEIVLVPSDAGGGLGFIGSLLFWAYLYVVGPYDVTFGTGGSATGIVLTSAYWSTVPDWAVLTNFGVPTAVSLAAFYSIIAGLVILLTRLRLYEARLFGALIHTMSFMAFFSSALISTPVIGSLLVVAFVHRIQQLREPDAHATGS
jgi:hypothetical protein